MMRFLFLTAYFPPDVGSAAHLFYELGTALVERGHRVTVLTGMPGYYAQGPLDKYNGERRLSENINGMHVIRISTPKMRTSLIGRTIWHFGGALQFFIAGLGLEKHDAVLLYSPPLPLGFTAWGWKKLRGMPFILNVQDLFPQSIIDLGLLENRIIIKVFEAMERFIYARSPTITVHSEGNRNHVIGRRGNPDRVVVVNNWVDTEFIQPEKRKNEFRKGYNLEGQFVVSFAGVLGYSQDLDIVLESAAILREYQDISWLIVGDGVEKERLVEKSKKLGLSNVIFVPMQPRDQYPAVLHASDVGLATLHAEVKTPVVPSKILSIMASGRPVISAMNLDGDAPELIRRAGCGINIPPEDAGALADAVLRLYHDPEVREQMGANGRKYAVQHLSLKVRTDQYEKIFKMLINN